MLKPEGRIVMVSGANRGIGLAVAKRLHAEGYTLSAGARDLGKLDAALGSLGKERLSFHRYDAQAPDICKAWVEETVTKWGRIDGLINVAGIQMASSIEDEDESAIDLMWEVNTKALLRMTRFALPHLRKSGTGRIVNIASLSGKRVRLPNVGYAMSKFAVMALTHATRRLAWDDGVRATAVAPGWVNTDLASGAKKSPEEMTDPNDLAELIANVIALPNNAAIAELLINSGREEML